MEITEKGEVSECIGCEIIHMPKEKMIVITQQRLIDTLEKLIVDSTLGRESRNVKTPAIPGSIIQKAESPDLISDEKHENYRTVVGKLLFLLKHSRPDLGNAVQELSKVLDNTEETHYCAMERCVDFVIKTRYYGLKIKPNATTIQLQGVADSSYASDKETCKSVSGWLIFFYNVLVSWKSRSQRSVTMSSTEAEYVGLVEMVCELLFIKNVLQSIGYCVNLPMMVYTDNIGAIYMTKNWTTSGRTKHIDTRYHFIREMVRDNILSVNFVGTKENQANMLTKNVGDVEYYKMMEKNMIETKTSLD